MSQEPQTETPKIAGMLPDEALAKAQFFLGEKDYETARTLCEDILRVVPGWQPAQGLLGAIVHGEHIAAAEEYFPGPDYQSTWLPWFHDTLKPKSYVEIGVESGASLRAAREDCRAIGIDPGLNVRFSLRAWTRLFSQPSDDFFFTYDPTEIVGVDHIDMAFIDGLHTFDQALKDFINIERYSHKNTVILFHDIFPVSSITAARDRVSSFWVGDTWKVIPLIREMRPDLKIFTIPTRPSGLAVITNCDPSSTVLRRNFERLVEKWMPVSVENRIDEMPALTNLLGSNTPEAVLDALK